MANGYLHGLFESIPGNETNAPTPSTKVIYIPVRSFGPRLGVNHLDRDDELRNVDEPIQVLPEAYAPGWDLETRAYPDVLGFLLKGALGSPVTTAGDGIITDPDAGTVPATATRHVWTAPYGPSGVSPQSIQWQPVYKDQSFYLKLKGCGTDSISIDSPGSGGVDVKASGPANYIVRGADPALTPTYESLAIPPFERSHLTLPTWLTGTGETEDFNIAISNPMDQVQTLGIASKFPDVLEKGDGPITVTGSVPKRIIDPDDWDALVAGTAFTVKAKWQSTKVIAATSYFYTLWFEANNCQYVEGSVNPLANRRRHGGDFSFKATYSGAAGSSKWTLVNGTASYV